MLHDGEDAVCALDVLDAFSSQITTPPPTPIFFLIYLTSGQLHSEPTPPPKSSNKCNLPPYLVHVIITFIILLRPNWAEKFESNCPPLQSTCPKLLKNYFSTPPSGPILHWILVGSDKVFEVNGLQWNLCGTSPLMSRKKWSFQIGGLSRQVQVACILMVEWNSHQWKNGVIR